MTTPILTWLLIVCAMAVFFITRAVLINMRRHRAATSHPHHIFEIGSETDELYIPGDATDDDCDTLNNPDN